MKEQVIGAICVITLIAVLFSGILFMKLSVRSSKSQNILPAVDILVIEDCPSVVYN